MKVINITLIYPSMLTHKKSSNKYNNDKISKIINVLK